MKTQILIMTLFFSIISCKSSKFEKITPFKVVKASYEPWFGGVPNVKGIKINISLQDVEKNIDFTKMYFKEKTAKIILIDNTITANINTASKKEIDMILDVNTTKEYGNELPKKKVGFPFTLKENECVIGYLVNKKERFYKLKLIKKEAIYYP